MHKLTLTHPWPNPGDLTIQLCEVVSSLCDVMQSSHISVRVGACLQKQVKTTMIFCETHFCVLLVIKLEFQQSKIEDYRKLADCRDLLHTYISEFVLQCLLLEGNLPEYYSSGQYCSVKLQLFMPL